MMYVCVHNFELGYRDTLKHALVFYRHIVFLSVMFVNQQSLEAYWVVLDRDGHQTWLPTSFDSWKMHTKVLL